MQDRQAPPGSRTPSQWVRVKPCGQDQWTRCRGSVHARKTRLRGASRTRVMTSCGWAGGRPALVLAVMSLASLLQITQVVFQSIEALVPEAAIVLDPVGRGGERPGVEPAARDSAVAGATDQAGALEHAEVFRDGGARDGERLGQLPDRRVAGGKPGEDGAAGAVAQRGVHGVETRCTG